MLGFLLMANHPPPKGRVFLLWVLTCFSVLLLTNAQAFGKKQKPQDESKDPTSKFKIAVDLISVNASVTDKKGNPIKDLTEGDFQIFEEGIPQKISVFRVEAAPGIAVAAPSAKESGAGQLVVSPLSRKVILFVDDYHLDISSLARLKTAGENFIRNGLGPIDLIALITTSGKYSTEFTKYREYVITNLKEIFPIANTRRTVSDCPPLTPYQAVEINLRQEFAGDVFTVAVRDTIRCDALEGIPDAIEIAKSLVLSTAKSKATEITEDTRRTLYSLQALARRLRAIEGQKVMVFLSDGLLIRDLEFQVQDAIDSMIRANTVVHTLDVAGLDATPLGGDASSSIFTTAESRPVRMRLQSIERSANEDMLNALASDTGGSFFHNNNDLLSQLRNAVAQTQVTYLLGYYSTNPKRDGKFRKITVRVNRPEVLVSARKGYFAPKGDETFEAEKNADIQEALHSAEDLKEIPVLVSYHVTHNDPARSLVSVQTRIDVKQIRFQKRESRNRNVFTIVTIVYDSNNRFLDGKETRIDFNLTDPNYHNVMQEGLRAQSNFQLEPGNYKVRTIVREAGETKMGSATKTIEILN